MFRARYLLYFGLLIYLLDPNMLGTDALSLLPKKNKSENEESGEDPGESAKKSKQETFYRDAYHVKSRETKSGEHLQYAYNPYCSWLKIFGFGGAQLQANCLLNEIIGPYKILKKYYLVVNAVL